MGNIYVDIVNEIYERLNTEKDNIDIGVKRVAVGTKEMIENLTGTPVIVIEPINFREVQSVASRGQKNLHSEMQVILNCTYPILNTIDDKLLYNTGEETGMLYFVENVLDIVNENTSGTKDPRLSEYAKQGIRGTFGNVQKHGEFYTFEILLDIVSKNFSFNGRQT